MICLCIQLEQSCVDILLVAICNLSAADFIQITHEESFAFRHLLLVPLGQLVQVRVLVQRGMRPDK